MPINLVRQFRLEKNLSKKLLAEKLNNSVSRVTAIENGSGASSDEYAIISLFLDVPTDELYPEQSNDWEDIEKKRQMIEIRRNIDLENLISQAEEREMQAEEREMQTEERERLQEEISEKINEKNKIDSRLRKITRDHEIKVREHEELTDRNTKNQILRELNFPPEYQEAGVTILQGFVKLIKRKYGNTNVSVTIKQTGLKVILIIKTPDGKEEEIEEFLDQYSQVIAGNQEVSSLTNDPIALIELKSQLDVAQLQVKQQRDINLLLKTNHDRRIESLEKENDWFKEQLALSVESSKAITHEVLSQLRNNDSQIAELATRLVDIVDKVESKTKQLASVEEKAESANKTIDELNKMILKEGVGKGVAESVRKLIKWATLHLIG